MPRLRRLAALLGAALAGCHAGSAPPPPPQGPTVTSVSPALVCTRQLTTSVAIAGAGFEPGSGAGPDPAVTLTRTGLLDGTPADGAAIAIPPALVTWSGATSGSFLASPTLGLAPGVHALSIRNPDGGEANLPAALAAVPPPAISGVSLVPDCGGSALELALSGSGFLRIDGAVPLVELTDEAGTVRDYDAQPIGCSAIASAVRPGVEACSGLLVSVGGGDLQPGEWLVYVENPAPVGCVGTAVFDAITAAQGEGWYVDPPVVPAGARTPVAIHLRSTAAPFPLVALVAPGGTEAVPSPATLDPIHPDTILSEVPAGLAAGTWDVRAGDAAGSCGALLSALTITSDASLALGDVDPPSGWTSRRSRVSVSASGRLAPGARAWLVPEDGGAAIALEAIDVPSPQRLEGVVPAGVPAASYDLVVVNLDGTAGRLAAAYASSALPPPTVDGGSPAYLAGDGAPLVLAGRHFRTPSVAFSCLVDEATGARDVRAAAVTAATSTSLTIASPPVAGLPAPTWCDVRVTNADGTFAELPALPVAAPDGTLGPARACAAALPAPRRAPVVLSAEAEPGARFVYAIGGDDGANAASTVFAARVGPRGCADPLSWTAAREALPAGRTLAGGAALGRYLYLVGGSDGSPTAAVLRAEVLDPAEAPSWSDVATDAPTSGGAAVGGGTWTYRVSAVMDPAHPDNPGGESLASEPVTVWLPPGGGRVALRWTGVDGATGYRVYRTPAPELGAGDAELLAAVGPALSYVDDGADTVPGARPLPLGAIGRWKALPDLGLARAGVAVALLPDPATAGAWYLYALGGRDGSGALGTWEVLPIDVDLAGRQWTASAWTAGATTFDPRDGAAAFPATSATLPALAGAVQLFLGPGAGGASVQGAEAASGGALGSWADATTTWPAGLSAPGAVTTGGFAYTFGGDLGGPVADVWAAPLQATSPPALGAFARAPGALSVARARPGVAVAGPVVLVVGGETAAGASTKVESLGW